jgi:PKD repeat protein
MKKVFMIFVLLVFISANLAQEFSITIDGEKDAWYYGLTNPEDGMINLPARSYLKDINPEGPDNDEDLSAMVWMAWDDTYLYLYEEVVDDSVTVNHLSNFQNDGLLFFINPDPFLYDDLYPILSVFSALGVDKAEVPEGVSFMETSLGDPAFYNSDGNAWEPTIADYAREQTENGYVLECRIPFEFTAFTSAKTIISPEIGNIFGLSINQIDNDTNIRDNQLQWSAGHSDEVWKNSLLLGIVKFLPDHKLKFEAANDIDNIIINDSALVWYYPEGTSLIEFCADTVSGKIPLTVNFSNMSMRNVDLWIWDFENDGAIDSQDKNPLYTFFEADSFSVKLIASDKFFPDTVIKVNYINAYFDTEPNLFDVKDIPDDQGGWVNLQFARSAYDTTASGVPGEYYSIEIDDGSGWFKADTIITGGVSIYSKNIPTPVDSTAESSGLLDFRVTAYMNAGTFVSQTVSGYSVDNRRPAAPKNLHALLTEELTVSLTWNTSNAPDLKQYTVYRSTDDFHFIGIGTTTDTTLVDDDVELNQEYYYVVTAMDSSGNESDFSVSVSITVAISNIGEDVSIPTHYYLAQNFPNPFNPVTTICYGLPTAGYVKIIIYDILGHKVRTLLDSRKTAGHHALKWNGKNSLGKTVSSGIYYYHIISNDFNQIKKMILLR